ncbi:enoyl-CoA hydratase-related protein [Acidovorax sp. CCYZU-2555]|uniref:enoyl-CoA hydratase/isomerase family protein n=1 Tax=Acidovorax sp. CCYZU-2555 TaxID=2835042 RepID=UPI001BD10472|nr:enoyl-CoA hydratase-related protein [Acidovorax sp. CCYZU-2555]MBS7780325.1 enoyl-CoA hydratase/isomerase family protein [Acidovorax sp. CCYZU-2555]
MTSSTQTLEPGIALLRLEQPARRNALSLAAMQTVHAQLDQLLADRSLRVLIVTGQGAGFCAGLDLKSVLNADAGFDSSVRAAMALQHAFAGLVQRLRDTDAAVIAAVNGVAVGAGMGLALAADIRFAAPQAAFHVGAVKIGLTAGECGISYHLPRLIGAGRAFEIMLSGRPVNADEAERLGLVAEVVPADGLLERALACARQITANATYATAHTKRVMWQNLDAASLQAAIELENHAQVLGLMTRDFQEAAQAFTQKRPPQFTGE